MSRTRILVSSFVFAAGCIASFAGTAAAQDPLFQSQHFVGPAGVDSLAAGDVDGDGDPDLVAGGSSVAQVLLNQGHRVFLPSASFTGGGTDVSLGDLDGDGVLDLVVTNYSPPAVRMRLGLGNGTFGAVTSFALSYAPAEGEIADLDVDGDLDVVVVQQDGRVKILLNDGAAGFTFALDVGPAGSLDKRIEVADLDGDAMPDLAVSAALGDIHFFRGLGQGVFEPAGGISSTFVPNDLAARDLDLDGDVDLAVVDETAGEDRLLVFVNDGNGSFSGPVFAAQLPFLPRYVSLADVDEDGLLDALVSQESSASSVHVFLGVGNLTFTPAPAVATTSPGEIVVTDLDADGDLDLAMTESLGGSRVALAWGEGDGTFRKGPPLVDSGEEVVVDDMNGDGRPDLVAASYGGVAVALNAGDGHLPAVLEQSGGSTDVFEYGVATGDVDGDGDADAVTARWHVDIAQPGAALFLNDGTGALGPASPLPVPPRMQDVVSADLDLDGDKDFLFVSNSGGPSPAQGLVQVLINQGDGTFPPAEYYGAPKAMQAIAIADFNVDGLPDVVTSTMFFGQLHVLLGNGDGTLGVPISTTGDTANDLVAADFNGDGKPDVAYTRGTTAPTLGVRLGNGDGTFGPVSSFGVGASYGHLAAGDVNHDGMADLVLGQSGLTIYLGSGDGTFQLGEFVETSVGSRRVLLADLDGDGWTDIAGSTGGDNSSELYVLRNQHGPWNDLGHPLAGTAGLPRQTGEGSLLGGSSFKFKLRDAKPFTKAYHVVGTGTLNAPFKGGVMVPTLSFVNPFPTTNAQGEVTLAGHWITLPSGLTLYFQFWLPDPAGIGGFAASNAISATLP